MIDLAEGRTPRAKLLFGHAASRDRLSIILSTDTETSCGYSWSGYSVLVIWFMLCYIILSYSQRCSTWPGGEFREPSFSTIWYDTMCYATVGGTCYANIIEFPFYPHFNVGCSLTCHRQHVSSSALRLSSPKPTLRWGYKGWDGDTRGRRYGFYAEYFPLPLPYDAAIWHDTTWYDMPRHDATVWHVVIWYAAVWHDLIWYATLRRYHVIWHDMVLVRCNISLLHHIILHHIINRTSWL